MGRNLLGDEYPHPPGFAPLEFFVKTVNFGEGFSICNFDHYLVEVRSACEICFIVSDIFLDLLWRLQLFNFEALPSLIYSFEGFGRLYSSSLIVFIKGVFIK